jgi:hypothetical protein
MVRDTVDEETRKTGEITHGTNHDGQEGKIMP